MQQILEKLSKSSPYAVATDSDDKDIFIITTTTTSTLPKFQDPISKLDNLYIS